MSDLAASYEEMLPPYELRCHQREAISAIGAAERVGGRRAWVVLPPGSGKTAVGLETIRQRGRRAVVLGPNIAIQNQWLATWYRYEPAPDAGTDRLLNASLTVLTYQALATFGDDDPEEDDGTLIGRLHPNGAALVEALRDAGPLTVVLDECHHLIEVWGGRSPRSSSSCRTPSSWA